MKELKVIPNKAIRIHGRLWRGSWNQNVALYENVCADEANPLIDVEYHGLSVGIN